MRTTYSLSPAIKGLITSILMIIVALFIDQFKNQVQPSVQYLIYLIYALGIFWVLIVYKRSPEYTGKMSTMFGQGFRCFIVITLLMVVFTAIFVKMHPEFAEQESQLTREYFIKQGDKTPLQLDELAANAKKQYAITIISVSIFRYLIFGAVITLAIAAFIRLTRSK